MRLALRDIQFMVSSLHQHSTQQTTLAEDHIAVIARESNTPADISPGLLFTQQGFVGLLVQVRPAQVPAPCSIMEKIVTP